LFGYVLRFLTKGLRRGGSIVGAYSGQESLIAHPARYLLANPTLFAFVSAGQRLIADSFQRLPAGSTLGVGHAGRYHLDPVRYIVPARLTNKLTAGRSDRCVDWAAQHARGSGGVQPATPLFGCQGG
jgi:hypothetical protein